MLDVRHAGYAGGENLRNVHAGARNGRARAHAEEKSARGDAVGHAKRTVDRLRRNADRERRPECAAFQRGQDDLQPGVPVVRQEQASCEIEGDGAKGYAGEPGGVAQHRMRHYRIGDLLDWPYFHRAGLEKGTRIILELRDRPARCR
jgi:hypothetical protein